MVYLGKSAMVLLLLFCLAAFVLPEQVKDDAGNRQRIYAYPTANSDASQEARDLLRTLYAVKGGYTLSGQHNYLEEPKKHTRRIHELTGELPALVGYEMGVVLDHTEAEVESYRQKIVDDAIATYKAGSFVTMTYHAAMPGQCQCSEQVNNGGISE